MRDYFQQAREVVFVRARKLQDKVNRLYKELDEYKSGKIPRDDVVEERIQGMIIAYEQLLLWDKYEEGDITPDFLKEEED